MAEPVQEAERVQGAVEAERGRAPVAEKVADVSGNVSGNGYGCWEKQLGPRALEPANSHVTLLAVDAWLLPRCRTGWQEAPTPPKKTPTSSLCK